MLFEVDDAEIKKYIRPSKSISHADLLHSELCALSPFPVASAGKPCYEVTMPA